jgi:hypothetical protein
MANGNGNGNDLTPPPAQPPVQNMLGLPDPNTLTGTATQPPPGPGAGVVGSGYNPDTGQAANRIEQQIERLRASGDIVSAQRLIPVLRAAQANQLQPPSGTKNFTPPAGTPDSVGVSVQPGSQQQQQVADSGYDRPSTASPAGPHPVAGVDYDPNTGKSLTATSAPVLTGEGRPVTREQLEHPLAAPATPAVTPAAYTGPHTDIYNMAQYYGVNPELALTTARIESNFGQDKDTPGSQYKGVFQLGNQEWSEMGGTDANRGDRATQVNLGTSLLARRQQEIANSLGRTPQNWEVYLAHNQGVAGATALLNNPNMTAKQALMTIPGMTEAQAEANIRGNGGAKYINAPASEYTSFWNNTYNHFAGEVGDLPVYAGPAVMPGATTAAYRSGQHIPGTSYAAGGVVSDVVPPRPAGEPTATLPPVNVEANTSGAGGPAGDSTTDAKVQAIADRFKNAPGAQQGRGWQMLALMSALMKGHTITPMTYNPANALPGRLPGTGTMSMEPINSGTAQLPLHNWRNPGAG